MFEFLKKHNATFELYCDRNEIADAMKCAKESGVNYYAWDAEPMPRCVGRVYLRLYWQAKRNQILKAAIKLAGTHRYAYSYNY